MIALLLSISFSAIPQKSFESYLQKPKEIRKTYFQNKQGSLENIIKDPQANFRHRWVAYSTWASLEPSPKRLLYGLKSHEWFLRDLGLKLAVKYNKNLALKWSKKLLKDPALVVRTTAAKNLAEIKDQNSLELLWQELYSKQNYRKNQSLWVRKHIVKAISKTYQGTEKKKWSHRFFKILKDRDENLYPYALYSLSNLYPDGPKVSKNEPVEIRKQKWLAWVR